MLDIIESRAEKKSLDVMDLTLTQHEPPPHMMNRHQVGPRLLSRW